MLAFIFIIVGLVIIGAIAGPMIFLHSRRTLREQKNFERGLKMVPLFIHLPPPSEDMQANGRDQRDLTDESISKATIIYNIIASTLQKGFKAKFYGQRHFGFEIVGTHGFVYFYAAVPVAMVDVVKQAVISAYPTARLEEVAEHNIFSPVGKLSSTVGGELNLKSSYAYPIATYQDLKRDAMLSLLNALSTLDKEDGAGIQLLMRPADPGWTKKASTIASKKRKGKDSKTGVDAVSSGARQFLTAFVKPPEPGKGDDPKPPKELSNLEQQVLDSIDDKTRYAGYDVLIRVVASSNISQRAQAILNNVIASFSLFDAPGKNGFKYTPAKDMESFVTSYIMRFFPQRRKKQNILNSVELATLFHFPDQQNTPTSQLTRQASKQVDGPRNMPEEGLLLGYNVFRGVKKPIRLALADRQRHMYVVGQTGVGKSVFLENLALQDMMNGDGFAFIDPHGDTAERLLAMVPKNRTEDVIYFSPADMDYPMGLNLFEFSNPDQKDFLIQETLNMLQKLYDPTHQGIMGPRYEHIFRNAALAVMADPNGGTFVDIPKLFRDPQFLKEKLEHVKDQTVLDFWQKEYPQSQRSNDAGEVTAWFVSKFGAFLSNEMMRNIIGQTKSAFDLRDIMDNKKILIVNLSKGRTGDLNSKLLGMIFVMKFQAAAMSRANIPEDQRQDFCLYVDEFQNFSTDSFATIMSEARKFRLNLIVANQFTTQLTPEIRDAVFGNMGTIVAFRIGQPDVEAITKYFQPAFDDDDLLRVPNYNTIVRTLVGGVPTNPFSMATLPPLGNPNPQLADALKQLTAAKYGRPKAVVEKDIFARMATRAVVSKPPAAGGFGTAPSGGFGARPGGFGAPAASPYGSPMNMGGGMGSAGGYGPQAGMGVAGSGGPAGSMAPPNGGGSFLDDWLSKRQQPSVAAARPYGPTGPAPAGYGNNPSSFGTAPTNPYAGPGPNVAQSPLPSSPAPTNSFDAAAPAPSTSPSVGADSATSSPLASTESVLDLKSAEAELSLPKTDTSKEPPKISHHTEPLHMQDEQPAANNSETAPDALMDPSAPADVSAPNGSNDSKKAEEADKPGESNEPAATTDVPLPAVHPPAPAPIANAGGAENPEDTIAIDGDGNLKIK